MATLRKIGDIISTGGVAFVIDATMFYVDSGYTIDSISLPDPDSTNVYVGCSKDGTLSLLPDNPASDSTCSFPVAWTAHDANGSISGTATVSAIVYHSLGGDHIDMTLIGNAIGSNLRKEGDLELVSTVNFCAQFCPDGAAPYQMGEFRWYAHSSPCGLVLKDESSGEVYGQPDGSSTSTAVVQAVASKAFKALSGTSFQYSKIWIEDSAGNIVTYVQKDLSTQTYDYINISVNVYTSQTYTVKGAMSADGSTWVNIPTNQFLSVDIPYVPPIFNASISNLSIDSNNFVSGDVYVQNNSAGDSTDFQMKVDTYWTNSDGTNDSQLGDWADLVTLDNDASTTIDNKGLGACGIGSTTNRRIVVSMRAGTSGTSYIILDHTFPNS